MNNILEIIPDSIFQDCEIFDSISDSENFWASNGLGIFHMNIGRIKSHFNELVLTLTPFISKIDIIILTETWYHPSYPYSFSITGYTGYFTSHQFNESSGIAVYVRNDLDLQTEELTHFTMANCLRLDLRLKDKKLTLLTMYRSPSGNATIFIEELDQFLHQIKNNRCLLVGDLNINILEQYMDNIGHEYLDTLHRHNYIPTVTTITRTKTNVRRDQLTTYTTLSCIDHINYKTRNLNEIKSAIIHTNISDHYSTITKLSLDYEKSSDPIIKQYKHIDYELLNEKLETQDWTNITNSDDPDFTASTLTEILSQHIDSCTEIKTYSNKMTPLKPWMTKALLLSLRNRDRLAKLTKRNPNNVRLLNYYKRVRNIVSKAIRTARDLELKRNIDRNRQDKRKLWTVIHDILDKHNNKSKIKTITYENIDYNCDTDTACCANIMNNYFKNVGKNIAETINNTRSPRNTLNEQETQHTGQNAPNNLSTFEPTTPTEVLTTMNKMKNNSAPGEDSLQTKVLKNITQYILSTDPHL
uniref:Endonuclease/exonuclease/phosphatase domain-containing protein n=1 Tax=Cacopsylla melanoneura TaxID=428564 RepID=A0A8D8XNE2_9HEMI